MGKTNFCTFPQFFCGKVPEGVDNSVDILWVLHKARFIFFIIIEFCGIEGGTRYWGGCRLKANSDGL